MDGLRVPRSGCMDGQRNSHSSNEPENVAVIIRPKTRRNLHLARRRQSWDIECAGMPREQHPIAGLKGILRGVDVNDRRIRVEVRAQSLQHGEQVNVPAAGVDRDNSIIRIQVLPVGFKCLLGYDRACLRRQSPSKNLRPRETWKRSGARRYQSGILYS